jgi:hypothetical protein
LPPSAACREEEKRPLAQEHAVDHREAGGVDADAGREDDDRGGREGAFFREQAEGEAQVLEHGAASHA